MDVDARQVAYPELRLGVVEAARHMERAGHSPGTSGNVSARIPDGMLITPSGVPPARMEPGTLVAMALDGSGMGEQSAPSAEWPMHAALYRARSELGGIVHCHSRFATILACTRRGIPPIHYMIAAIGGADVPCAPYATFGTDELSRVTLEAMGGRKACLLANHGQIAVGVDLEDAVRMAEEVERQAETYWGALAIGGEVQLSPEQLSDVVRRYLAGYGQESK
jgi:L-fuculose-phosphate aldolase